MLYLSGIPESAARHLNTAQQSTVGSAVSVRHLAPTPVGMRVRFHVEVAEVDGRRLRFTGDAHDASGEKVAVLVDHERFVVDSARFMARVAAKAAKYAAAHEGESSS